MNQKYIFLSGEGDRWFERNREKLGEHDPVTPLLDQVIAPPRRVLEIGCSNGWRLAKLRDKYGCEVMGVEPSMKAAAAAAEMLVPVVQSTASSLPISGVFDLIIYGFALYLTDPEDWLLIAAEADHVLAPGGHIVIHDFGGADLTLHGVPYKHDARITSWHYDWAKLWLGNPAYEEVHRHWTTGDGLPDQQVITVLRKNKVKP